MDNVKVNLVNCENMDEKEIQNYINYVKKQIHAGVMLKSITITLQVDGENVAIEYETGQLGFERIRRITGYLVGGMNRWNNAKRKEEKDRVKHGL